jgi:hypothetical protein
MSKASEFFVNLCFIRSEKEAGPMLEHVEASLDQTFHKSPVRRVFRRVDKGLEIVTAEVNGLSAWSCEEEVLDHLEAHLDDDCIRWLQGYMINVLLKEDAGPCQLKARKA